jgi:Uma2 family endonuclease
MAYAIPESDRRSLADLEAMPDDDLRYELLGGRIYMTPSPVPNHQAISAGLERLIDANLPAGHHGFHAPIDLDLVDEQRAVPDIVVIADEYIGEKRLTGPALLVVEIISPGTRRRDYGIKARAYAASGVEHYWIVDAHADRVVAHRLAASGTYEIVLDQVGGVVELHEPVAAVFTLKDLGLGR